MSDTSLGEFLREVANWNWEQFCLAEHDPQYTSNQAAIFALIRACAMEKIDAIKLALNRLDGKLKTPVRLEFPKIYWLFPDAALPEAVSSTQLIEQKNYSKTEQKSSSKDEATEVPLQEMSLRQTLTKMANHPRQVPEAVIAFATLTQQWLNGNAPEPEEKPLVKSVLAAHLLHIAHGRDISALEEVFNQIDGKLVETIQVLGDDLYITSYASEAPPGAYLNKDGVLQIEATAAQNLWAAKLGALNGR